MKVFGFDLETALIVPGLQAPPMVCLTYCVDGGQPQILHVRDAKAVIQEALESCLLVCHNIAYDMTVVCAQWPDLTPLVFRAYDENRVTCTETRQKLIDIAQGRERGEKKLPYDLGSCSMRANGPVLDKNDPWRLRYGTLYGMPVEQWPEEARSYALKDAEATYAVWAAQETFPKSYLVDQFRQARADFALKLMVAWGLQVDRAAAERYIAQVQASLAEDTALCLQHGLVRPDGTKDTKAAQAWMARVCEEAGEKPPLTEGGLPSLSEEAVEEHGDYVLEAYQRYANANTRTKRAERLLKAAVAGVPIQARFNVLVNTGRVSCSQGDGKRKKSQQYDPVSAYGAQIQNVSKEKGYREVFVARPGYALVSIDYDSLELRCWSQVCLWLFGYSRMAESINAGGDQHTELAAQLIGVSKEEAYRLKKTDPSFSEGPRFFSKAANFGFLANMGATKFCSSLVKQAVHLGKKDVIEKAKAYTVDEAKGLKRAFLSQWEEGNDYFGWVELQLRRHGQGEDKERVATVKHFKSDRLRGRCFYTQFCNSPFQGLAADLVKDAAWRVVRECYTDKRSPLFGSRLVNKIHDELLLEIPLAMLHEAAYRARDIMCATGNEWCEGLKFTAEPAAMLRWSKTAATILDSKGKLVPWTDK